MQNQFSLEQIQKTKTEQELAQCNDVTRMFGLSLSAGQIQVLAQKRFQSLKDTDRVEFGEGVLKKLVYAFCDSPYLSQDSYAQALADLQDLFYSLKNACADRLSDDELIEKMASVFNGRARGSLQYLTDLLLEELNAAEGQGEPTKQQILEMLAKEEGKTNE
ncbi:MAG: DUF6323 family protein [Oscillospiraceae bacterium]|jgi:hypothetical protein|nr:DUF6323 family protein [Oscillospiraceae bacterium]MDD3260684.1 DUF6323 family protein [Oscillospiraceae bacterium]